MKILNPWKSNKYQKEYYEIDKPCYQKGDCQVYKQYNCCFLYIYKGRVINQISGLNREHVNNILAQVRPEDDQNGFLFDRAMDNYRIELSD